MKALFSLFLTSLILFLFGISSFVAAQSKNEFWIGVGRVRFFDWTVNAPNWQGGYSRIIDSKFIIHSDISYTGHSLYTHGFRDEDFSTGDVFSRDDWLIDGSLGYNIYNSSDHRLTFETFAGLSFISGMDIYFNYIVDNSFPEISVYGKYRNDPGCNLGFQINYFPFSRMSIGLRNKLYIFTNPPADISIGAFIGIRFGDPHFKKVSDIDRVQ